jgi:DNA polymerase I
VTVSHALIGPKEGSYRLRQLEPDNESQLLAVDFETTGLDLRNDRLRLCSFLPFGWVERGTAKVSATSVVDLWAGSWVDAQAFLSDVCRFVLVAHNAQFEVSGLIANGHWPQKRVHCTLVLAQLVLAGERGDALTVYKSPGLAKCVRYFLGQTLSKEEQTSEWSRPQLTQSQIDYAAADVEILPPLFRHLVQRIRTEKLADVARIESEAVPAVGWMASMGMPFDQCVWDNAARTATDRLNEHFATLRTHLTDDVLYAIDGGQTGLGFVNDDRAQQVLQSPAKLLKFFRDLGVPIDSTADEVLSTLEHPAAEALRNYRTYETTLKMFGGSWGTQSLADLKRNVPAPVRFGRVYPGWKQNSTEAGRFSANRPNVQQVPNPKTHPMGKALRGAFRTGSGRTLVVCDLSQIQLRIAAEISEDRTMCEAYATGQDIHTLMAQRILGVEVPSDSDRSIAKSANFGLLFGAGAKTFRGYARANYGIDMSEDRAAEIRNAWLTTFPGIRAWHRKTGADIERSKGGITTRTLAGRTRKGLTFYSEALCSPIQGTEADIVKYALGLIYTRRDSAPQPPALSYAQRGWFPVAVIHDEIVLECDEAGAQEMADWLRGIMIEAGNRFLSRVPCDAEAKVRKSWA